MEDECPKCHEKANKVRCDYICKGIVPEWKSANRPNLYGGPLYPRHKIGERP